MKLPLPIAACLIVMNGLYAGHCGLFFDDPIDLQARKHPRPFGDDQIIFQLLGDHKNICLSSGVYTLEVRYHDRTDTLKTYKPAMWHDDELVFDIPRGLQNIQSIRLTAKGKDGGPLTMLRLEKGFKLKPTGSDEADWKEIMKHTKIVTGFKVDSEWTFKSQ